MIKSMTGYGKAVCEPENKKITIELKTLNSKQLDISTRIPSFYREKELELRNETGKALQRGKVDLIIYSELTGADNISEINTDVVKAYFGQLKEISGQLNIAADEQLLHAVMRLPDTLKTTHAEPDEAEWKEIRKAFRIVLDKVNGFREQEGKSMEKDIVSHIVKIEELLKEIDKPEQERTREIKNRLSSNLQEFFDKEALDKNRLEQEIIYYIEKLDICEEKVRLRSHCRYFSETMKEPPPNGKKLTFISQEIGREINTIGAKAYDAGIQKIVVQMKDELEKVKEQLGNVL